jgi:hypothetical protein
VFFYFFFPARSLARVPAWGCFANANAMLPDAVRHADAEERVPVTPAVSRGGQGSRVRFGVVARLGGKGERHGAVVNHRSLARHGLIDVVM